MDRFHTVFVLTLQHHLDFLLNFRDDIRGQQPPVD
jgi:hypothetical protein